MPSRVALQRRRQAVFAGALGIIRQPGLCLTQLADDHAGGHNHGRSGPMPVTGISSDWRLREVRMARRHQRWPQAGARPMRVLITTARESMLGFITLVALWVGPTSLAAQSGERAALPKRVVIQNATDPYRARRADRALLGGPGHAPLRAGAIRPRPRGAPA